VTRIGFVKLEIEVDMTPGPNADKTEWRYWAKTTRAKLPDVSERVCLHLEQFLNDLSLETGRPLVVLAYRALPDEIRLGSLVANLPELTWLTTRVQPGVSLSLHEYALATVRNRWGMLEPPEDSPSVPFASVDVVLVPGLAFDVRGSRLGFGRGYYDRLLALLGPDVLRVGVTREALVVDHLPSDPWDVPMTHMATGGGVDEILLGSVL
jgi:5-formyltetrahydrofolate cyclo-ligase